MQPSQPMGVEMRHGGQSSGGWRRKCCPKHKKRREWRRWGNSEGKTHTSCEFSEAQKRGKKVKVNKHHMTNKKHGGTVSPWNILWMEIGRHKILHHFFGNLKWEAIGEILFYGELRNLRMFRRLSIFHKRDRMDCVRVIDRVSLAKGRVTREIMAKLGKAA